jgi:hypothetical protein
MRVYVASKFENGSEVRKAQQTLREDGHTITHDWTEENAEGFHGTALELYLRECARKDYDGVLACDAFVLLHYERGAGMFTELGLAIAWRRLVVVIDGKNPDKVHNIFFHLPDVVHVPSLEEARWVLKAKEAVDK